MRKDHFKGRAIDVDVSGMGFPQLGQTLARFGRAVMGWEPWSEDEIDEMFRVSRLRSQTRHAAFNRLRSARRRLWLGWYLPMAMIAATVGLLLLGWANG